MKHDRANTPVAYISTYFSPLGAMTLASDGHAITGLWFDGQKYFARTLPERHAVRALPVLEEAHAWLDLYFSGKQPDFMPRLMPTGSPFAQTVWRLLSTIPYGHVVTYKALAQQVARLLKVPHSSAQAIGGAVSRNPISLLIPCHRVVGTSGSLTGYAGGLQRKWRLLQGEGVDMSSLFIPQTTDASPSRTLNDNPQSFRQLL